MRSLIAVMSFGNTDVDAVSSTSSFIILFSSIISVSSKTAVSILSRISSVARNDCEGWPHSVENEVCSSLRRLL